MVEKSTNFEEIGDIYFQKCIIASLLGDRAYADRMLEVMEPAFFTVNHLAEISRCIIDYRQQYKTYPSIAVINTVIKSKYNKDSQNIIRDEILLFLASIPKIMESQGDIRFVKEKSLDFCKKQKLKDAILQSIDLIKRDSYDNIASLIQKALLCGSENDVGHVYESEEAINIRCSDDDDRKPVATPWPFVNGNLAGGLGGGELGVVIAPTGIGKSHWLVNIGAAALIEGKNVIHYTFELRDTIVGRRYDSCITGIPYHDIPKRRAELETQIQEISGKLIVKKFPTKRVTINGIANHIEKLRAINDFEADIIVLDYADLMRSTKQYDAKRFELELIYEELRGLAAEIDIPCWTASQSNRSAANDEIITIDAIGEAYAKAQIADVVFTLSRTLADKRSGAGRSLLAKSRSGVDGVVYPLLINTANSRIEYLQPGGEEEMRNGFKKLLEADRDQLRDKLAEKYFSSQ